MKHQILAIAEEEGAEDASYSLKLLQSDGTLVFASPVKQPDGSIRTQEVRIEGPIMLILTTTKSAIDGELDNRCVKLTVDENAAQTAAIHQRQRDGDTWNGLALHLTTDAIIRLHRNAQRLLRPVKVVNPYAPRLTFAIDRARMRRDHRKYLDLIKAVTFLHQFQRTRETREIAGKKVEAVITTPDDIRLANRIAHIVLGRSLDDLAPQPRRMLGLIWDVVAPWARAAGLAVSQYDWTVRQVLPHLPIGESQLRAQLLQLIEHEWIVSHRGSVAEAMRYRLLADERPDDSSHHCLGLIDPDSLDDPNNTYDDSSDDEKGPSDDDKAPV